MKDTKFIQNVYFYTYEKTLLSHQRNIFVRVKNTVNNVNLFNLNHKNIIKRKTQDNISLLFSNQSTVYLLREVEGENLKVIDKSREFYG